MRLSRAVGETRRAEFNYVCREIEDISLGICIYFGLVVEWSTLAHRSFHFINDISSFLGIYIYIYSNVGEMESDFPDEVYWNMKKSVEREVGWKDGLSRGLSIYIYI